MKYSQCKQGRVFVIRLEDGDIVHTEIEKLARNESIKAATMVIIGGADAGSKLVAGPEHGRQNPVLPLQIERWQVPAEQLELIPLVLQRTFVECQGHDSMRWFDGAAMRLLRESTFR